MARMSLTVRTVPPALAAWTGLTSLDVRYSGRERRGLLGPILQLKGLQSLSLEDAAVNTEELRGIGRLRRLTSLNLSRIFEVDDTVAHALSPLTALTRLDLWRCNITDSGLSAITHLTGLTDLNLGVNALVTDSGLETLSALTGLTRLAVGGTGIYGSPVLTSGVLDHWLPLARLRSLSMSDMIFEAPRLERFPSLTSLQLMHTSVTNETLLELPRLARISLRENFHLTQAGVDAMQRRWAELDAADENV
jgi:hypothetical protein